MLFCALFLHSCLPRIREGRAKNHSTWSLRRRPKAQSQSLFLPEPRVWCPSCGINFSSMIFQTKFFLEHPIQEVYLAKIRSSSVLEEVEVVAGVNSSDCLTWPCMYVWLFLPALAAVIFRIKPFLRIPLPWERVGLLISLVGTNNPLPIVSGDNERNSETKAIIYFWNGHLRFIPSCNKANSLPLSFCKFSRTNWDLSVCSVCLFVFEVEFSIWIPGEQGSLFTAKIEFFIKANFRILSFFMRMKFEFSFFCFVKRGPK